MVWGKSCFVLSARFFFVYCTWQDFVNFFLPEKHMTYGWIPDFERIWLMWALEGCTVEGGLLDCWSWESNGGPPRFSWFKIYSRCDKDLVLIMQKGWEPPFIALTLSLCFLSWSNVMHHFFPSANSDFDRWWIGEVSCMWIGIPSWCRWGGKNFRFSHGKIRWYFNRFSILLQLATESCRFI